MKRVKSALTDVGSRQRRRRIAYEIQGEIKNYTAAELEDATAQALNAELASEVMEGGTTEAFAPAHDHNTDISDSDSIQLSIDYDTEETDSPTAARASTFQEQHPQETSLREKLRRWALETKIPASHLSALLKVLKPDHPELPVDARTLLRTPRTTEVVTMSDGSFYYFGIRPSLLEHISRYIPEECNILSLIVNADGMSISGSSKREFWPVLMKVKESENGSPFVVALYEGEGKPADLQAYMKNFLDEMDELLREGLTCQGRSFTVVLHAFICDAPARAYLKGTKGHTGYYACEKCTQKGKRSKDGRKVIFPDTDCPLRTNRSFELQLQSLHHRKESPLLSLGVGLVSQFPLDYMHLVCLGVMRKLLQQYWVSKKPCSVKMAPSSKASVSDSLSRFNEYAPSDMKRRPRSLAFVEHWKAVEYRNFLLYYGPVVLKGRLKTDLLFEHFMKFNVAMTILISPRFSASHSDIADRLIREFISEAEKLYGDGIYVYNVHSLLHIVSDVRNYGPLDSFSAFPFENYLHQIKTLVKSHARALQQVVRRITERKMVKANEQKLASAKLSGKHSNGPLPQGFDGEQYSRLETKDTVLGLSRKDNCVKMIDGNIVWIANILHSPQGVNICGFFFTKVDNLYTQPIPSSTLNVYIASEVSATCAVWKMEDIDHKCVCLPRGAGYAIFPLLHTFKQEPTFD